MFRVDVRGAWPQARSCKHGVWTRRDNCFFPQDRLDSARARIFRATCAIAQPPPEETGVYHVILTGIREVWAHLHYTETV